MLGLTLLAMRVAISSLRVMGWILAAAAIAGMLQPMVAALDRRLPRGLAVAVVAVGTLAVTGLVTYRAVDSVRAETQRLQRAAPAAARRLEADEGRLSELARQTMLSERVEAFVEEVPKRLRGGTATEALQSAATRGIAFLATGVLSLFFLLHGSKLAAGALSQIADPRRRARVERIGLAAFHHGFGYARGSAAMAVAAGAVAYLLASAAHVPGAVPLAVWVALWDLVPVVGAALGAIPIVALASVGHPGRGLALALAFAAYEVVETVVTQRWVERRTVRVGPFLTTAGGFAGLELYGIGGALLSLLVIAVVVAGLRELAVTSERAGPAAQPP